MPQLKLDHITITGHFRIDYRDQSSGPPGVSPAVARIQGPARDGDGEV